MKSRVIQISVFFVFCFVFSQTLRAQKVSSESRITQFPYSVAVVFSDELELYTLEGLDKLIPGSPERDAMLFDKVGDMSYLVGDELSSSLFMSVSSAYSDADSIIGYPLAGDYDRIIKFSFQKDKCHIFLTRERFKSFYGTRNEPAKSTQHIRFDVSILMEAYDGETLDFIRKREVIGIGRFVVPYLFSGSQRKLSTLQFEVELNKIVDSAIQDVKEKVSNLLKKGFAEPKRLSFNI